MRVFKPRRSTGWLWMVALSLFTLALGVVSALPLLTAPADDSLVVTLILVPTLLLMLAVGAAGLLFAAWFPTMRYELDAHTLTLRYGPVLTYRIPLDEIQTIRKRDLSISLWSSMRLPGLALFTVPYTDVGKVKMCATAAAIDILLIEMTTDKYGLTPADEKGLVAALHARMGE